MIVEIRLYKRFDTDLVSLFDSGFPIASMLRDAVIGYANGKPVHYFIDKPVTLDNNNSRTVHTRFAVTDGNTCYLLQHIKKGFRNTFCKDVLRNVLVQQNLSCFFDDTQLISMQNANMAGRNMYAFQNVIPCSQIKNDNTENKGTNDASPIGKPGSPLQKRNPVPILTNVPLPTVQAIPMNMPAGLTVNQSSGMAPPYPVPDETGNASQTGTATVPKIMVSDTANTTVPAPAPAPAHIVTAPGPTPVPVSEPLHTDIQTADDQSLLKMFDNL